MPPQERNQITLADAKDRFGLPVAEVTFSYYENDRKLYQHALRFMTRSMQAIGARDIWSNEDTAHLNGTCRMGSSPRDSMVNADGRSWDIPNLWVCDGSVFPTVGGMNPSLTIQALACRIGDRIAAMASGGT